MKTALRLFLCFLILNQLALSQPTDNARFNLSTPGIQKWYPGWYVNLTGDTTRGFVFLSNQIDNQITFRFSKDGPAGIDEKVIEVTHASAFKVKDRTYECLPVTTNTSPSNVFIRRMETGRLKYYVWYHLPASGTMYDGSYQRPITVNDEKFHEAIPMLRMNNEPPFLVPSSKNFADVMGKLLADDADLSEKITGKLKGYRSADILNIVQEYNQWYVDSHLK
jgi:hypothetical protein